MELQGHVLIPEFYIISPHVYKWCKTSTVVFLIQNKHLFYGKKLYFISTQTAHFFQIAKINSKISTTGGRF